MKDFAVACLAAMACFVAVQLLSGTPSGAVSKGGLTSGAKVTIPN